ncbi:MAG: protein kinase [Acidobacteria bacterium]|nr:protein kinase [Acidobacteriota bacterium]
MSTDRRAPIPFPLPEDLTGSKVGRYVIRSKLGVGGMGEVYHAEDTKLNRPVALKRVAHRLGSDPVFRSRILREAQHASTLASEHIAAIFDVLEEQGELFLVMEYVEGETLRRRLRQPLTLEQFFPIATQCVAAVVAAHDHGIVHCDIKPENIMLTPEGQVKILDFGLAKHLPRSDRSSTFESCRSLAGTSGYMAPEVLLEEMPDVRTDVFSLGVVLYEMLTLQQPFFTGNFVTTSERILHETPTAIRVFNPLVPEPLAGVIMKALAKAPAHRHANARELLGDLHRIQSGDFSREVETPTPLPQPGKRKRWLAAAIILMVGVAIVIYPSPPSTPPLAERGWMLISDFDTSGNGAIPDKGVREGLTIALQQSRYVNVFSRTRIYEVLQRMKKDGSPRIDEGLGREICQRENLQVLLTGSTERRGQVFQITVRAMDPVQGTFLFAELERFEREDQFFDRADSLAKKIRKDLGESLDHIQKNSRPLARVTTPSLAALQLYSRAQDAQDQGRDEQIEGLLRGALELDPDFAMAHLRLGQFYSAAVGKNEKAVTELERAYQLRQGLMEREQHRIEAGYYGLQERYEDEAQSLSILVSLYPDDEEAHRELAAAYYDTGQIDKAILELREVLRLNANSAPAFRSLVFYLAHSNQNQAAIAAAREAQKRGIDPPQMHWGLGLAYLAEDEVSTARHEFQRIGRATETDRELQELNLVVADLYEGKLDSAKAMLAKQIQAAPPRSGGLQTIRRYLLGRIHLSQGNVGGAIAQAGLILQEPGNGLQTFDLLNAGILYVRAGRIDQARQILRRLDRSRTSVPSAWNLSCLHNLEAEISLAADMPLEAERSFTSALQEYPQAFSHAGLASAYQAQSRWELAAREWEQVLHNKGETLQGGFPPDLVDAHLQLARVYRAMNKHDLASEHYTEVLRMRQHAHELPLLNDARREMQELSLQNITR